MQTALYTIPQIDTSRIPGSALVGTQLGDSIARLDQIDSSETGSPTHAQLVQRVINDARDSGFSILA